MADMEQVYSSAKICPYTPDMCSQVKENCTLTLEPRKGDNTLLSMLHFIDIINNYLQILLVCLKSRTIMKSLFTFGKRGVMQLVAKLNQTTLNTLNYPIWKPN